MVGCLCSVSPFLLPTLQACMLQKHAKKREATAKPPTLQSCMLQKHATKREATAKHNHVSTDLQEETAAKRGKLLQNACCMCYTPVGKNYCCLFYSFVFLHWNLHWNLHSRKKNIVVFVTLLSVSHSRRKNYFAPPLLFLPKSRPSKTN